MMVPSTGGASESLLSQVEGISPLPPTELASLLADLRASGSEEARRRLAEQHLGVALEAARARASAVASIDDLFQEGAAMVLAALDGYAAGPGPASGLREHVEREVGPYVEAQADRLEQCHRADEQLIADAQQLERTLVELRRRLGRPATGAEVAAALEWDSDRVEVVTEMIADARTRDDEEISLYLDDEES